MEEAADVYDYEYTDWGLDTVDLDFVSVNDLQNLLEREAPSPVEIYRETARIDAHLLKELDDVRLPIKLTDTTSSTSLPTYSDQTNLFSSSKPWTATIQTFTESVVGSATSAPTTVGSSASSSVYKAVSYTAQHESTDVMTLVSSASSSASSSSFTAEITSSSSAASAAWDGEYREALAGRAGHPADQQRREETVLFDLINVSEVWLWLVFSLLGIILIFTLTIIFVRMRSSRNDQGKGRRKPEHTESQNYMRYSSGFEDTSRFVVNLKQEYRQDTIVEIRGDPELSGYLSHQIVSPGGSPPDEKSPPAVLSTFTPTQPRRIPPEDISGTTGATDARQDSVDSFQDIANRNATAVAVAAQGSPSLENSSDLEESNSGQLCQTYSEHRCIPAAESPEPEDDATETSGVLEKDEGIESEEEIDPNVFKNLILSNVRENLAQLPNSFNLAQLPNSITNEKEELYAKINFEAKYRNRVTRWRTTGSPSNSIGSDGNSPTITPPYQTQPVCLPGEKHNETNFMTSFSGSESECLI